MRTRDEILTEEYRKEFPNAKLDMGDFDSFIYHAMDAWHKECLPTNEEIEERWPPMPIPHGSDLRAQVAARWCRNFKRKVVIDEDKNGSFIKHDGKLFKYHDHITIGRDIHSIDITNRQSKSGQLYWTNRFYLLRSAVGLLWDVESNSHSLYHRNDFLLPHGEFDVFMFIAYTDLENNKTTRGNFVWNGKDSVKFIPDENGTVTVIDNSKYQTQ